MTKGDVVISNSPLHPHHHHRHHHHHHHHLQFPLKPEVDANEDDDDDGLSDDEDDDDDGRNRTRPSIALQNGNTSGDYDDDYHLQKSTILSRQMKILYHITSSLLNYY